MKNPFISTYSIEHKGEKKTVIAYSLVEVISSVTRRVCNPPSIFWINKKILIETSLRKHTLTKITILIERQIKKTNKPKM